MGYRSDIRLIIKKEGLDVIKKLCEKEQGELQKNLIERAKIRKDVLDLIYIGWNRINGADADFIENALNSVEENDITYKIAIIGENYDDIKMYEYVSEKDKNIPKPYVERKFNEDEITEKLESYSKQMEKETIEY